MLEAFLWALVAALALALIGWVLRTPERRRIRRSAENLREITDAATHRAIVSRNGYTLHLVSEAGDEVGLQEHGRFTPSFYRPGEPFTYRSIAYEIVSVQDDYPAAKGTLVLRRAPE